MGKAEQHNRLYTRVWRDPAFRALSERARNVTRYMLTGPHRTSEGLYYVTPAMVADDIGCTVDEACEAIREGTQSGVYRYSFESTLAVLPKALRYQRTTNSNHAKGVADRVANLHDHTFTPTLYWAAVEHGDKYLVEALDALNLPEIVATKPNGKDSESASGTPSESTAEPLSNPIHLDKLGNSAPVGSQPFSENASVSRPGHFNEDPGPFDEQGAA